MGENSNLYELVWGEPVPSPATGDRRAPAEPAPELSQFVPEPQPTWLAQSSGREDVAARLDAIERSMYELLQAVQSMRASTLSQDMVLISLEGLESRMGRMEKGLVRSLEHLESMIIRSKRH